jgi:hypothetical protein
VHATVTIKPPASSFRIWVKPTGTKAFNIVLERFYKVEKLKAIIRDVLNIPVYQQILVFAGKTLRDGLDCNDYNISKNSTVYVTRQHHLGSMHPESSSTVNWVALMAQRINIKVTAQRIFECDCFGP